MSNFLGPPPLLGARTRSVVIVSRAEAIVPDRDSVLTLLTASSSLIPEGRTSTRASLPEHGPRNPPARRGRPAHPLVPRRQPDRRRVRAARLRHHARRLACARVPPARSGGGRSQAAGRVRTRPHPPRA